MRSPGRFAALLLLVLAAVAGRAAETADPAATDSVTTAPALATQRDAAEERYQRLMAEDRTAEASAAAEEMLAITRQLHGPDSVETAGPLTLLATAQLRGGVLVDAQANFQAAIALLEKREGFLAPALAGPLMGLGEAYIRSEQYSPATEVYERALRVNHVNEGFYNLEQIPIRDGLTESYLGQQNLEKANFHQEAEVYVEQRKLGKNNPEFIPALTKLARWYDRTNQTAAARNAYQNAAQLMEKANGENSPALVDQLIAIAETYRQEALLPSGPDTTQSPDSLLPMCSMMLRRALAIVDAQQPPDPAKRAQILVALGDLYLMWGKRNSASDRYLEAWQLLSADPALEAQRDEYFAQPARILGPLLPGIYPPPSRKDAPLAAKNLEPGFIVIRFDVDQAGRVTDVTTIEADPANLLEERAARAAENSLYRPRYVDGTPVATTGVTLRHQFRYAPGKLEKEGAPATGEDSAPLEQPTSATTGP